ncbi:MAG: DNA double-strand break repair nuclease NurA [Pyrinomonadaceae bacterium]
MLFRELLTQELTSKRDEFARFAESQSDEIESYLALIQELSLKKGAEEVKADLNDRRKENVGAIPSDELDQLKSIKLAFEPRWQNHEEARSWALQVLQDRTTFAADGSQITFEREISLRVAAIQVGTFENPHNADGSYRKQASILIVSPQDIANFADEFEEPIRTATIIGLRRFQAEVKALKKFLESKRGWHERAERMPLAFFDGTLLISFSQPNSSVQHQYIETARQLVLLSKEVQVPLVGYIAQSEARDLIGLLDNLTSRNMLHQPSKTLIDAELLSVKTLQNWGDRTIFFRCERQGLSDYFVDLDNNALVGLVYLQTTSDSIPARLDIPAWIYESGLLAEVVDTVRAECVVGLGYPYALETADATAVLTVRDRETFLRALQDFSARENLNFRVSNKRMSKARRR